MVVLESIPTVDLTSAGILGGILVLVVSGIIRYLLAENRALREELKKANTDAIAAVKVQAEAQAKTIAVLEMAINAQTPRKESAPR